MQRSRLRKAALLAGLGLVACAAGVGWWSLGLLPKRFGVVDEGRLYRSGTITPGQLERLARERGVRAVLSLLDPDAPESLAEREAAARLGLAWFNVRLPGDGSSTPEQRERIREIVCDPQHGRLLVHCAAGANRTGLAVGLYRIHEQGWTYERVLEEMRAFGFDDLPKHEPLREALRREAEARAARP